MSIIYSQNKKDSIRKLYASGISLREVSKIEKVSYSFTFKICKDILRTKSEAHKGKMPKNIDIFLKDRKNYILTDDQRKKRSELYKARGIRPPSRKGAVPWNYVGATKLAERIRKNWKYNEWRSKIFERDLYTCINCNSKGVRIEADHYPVSFSEILRSLNITTLEQALECKLLWNIDNGRTLCKPCHQLTPNYLKGRIKDKEMIYLGDL